MRRWNHQGSTDDRAISGNDAQWIGGVEVIAAMTPKQQILESDEPPRHDINFESIPERLTSLARFLPWKWVRNAIKWGKMPLNRMGGAGSSTDPQSWVDFATAVQLCEINNWGIGFVFNGDGLVGFDFDNCRDPLTGDLAPWVQDFLAKLGTYAEVSPSGTGVKAFVIGVLPEHFTKKFKRPEDDGEVEIYSTGRFFTVTGNRVHGTPDDVQERQSALTAIYNYLTSWNPKQQASTEQTNGHSKAVDFQSTVNGSDDIATAVAALAVIDGFDDYEIWIRVGQALHSVCASLLAEWIRWSSQSQKFVDGECERKWKGFSSSGKGVGIGTLCHMADQTDRTWRPERPRRTDCSNSQDPAINSSAMKPNEASNDPHRLARLHLKQKHTLPNGAKTLVSWQGEFWSWNDFAYVPLKSHSITAAITATAKAEFDRINLWELENYQPKKDSDKPPTVQPVTKSLLSNVTNAVASLSTIDDYLTMPCWLTDEPFPAREVLATRKRLLHLPSLLAGTCEGVLPTPQFFSSTCLDFDYDPVAECTTWLEFLKSIWPNDQQSIDALQEFIGYLLAWDASQHKMLLLIGPTRSGKGTITRLLRRLLGTGNIASPTLSSLSENFGLWPLLNKSVGLIPDARLSGREDATVIVERLLSITGEDPQDVHRKCMPTLTGVRMPIRFVLMSNELPNLRDASGAFMSRVILLRMTESFLGREDKTLDKRLHQELPGILNWAIEGWKRLNARGHFIQPESANEMLEDFATLSSPIKAFIADCCEVGTGHMVVVDDLYDTWSRWCEANHRDHPGTTQTFGKDLRAAISNLTSGQRRICGVPKRYFEGIGLRKDDVNC